MELQGRERTAREPLLNSPRRTVPLTHVCVLFCNPIKFCFIQFWLSFYWFGEIIIPPLSKVFKKTILNALISNYVKMHDRRDALRFGANFIMYTYY